ncbi:MAG: peptidase S41 [Blastopirellula sp.]|nr:MAG: peptidase S41 [Blastopirellula sp.]
MPRFNLAIIFAASVISLVCYKASERNRFTQMFGEVLNIISYEYVRNIDQEELFDAAMTGMTTPLDQNSTYLPPHVLPDFKADLDQEFGGIGIRIFYDEEKHEIQVVSPLAGAPAYEAGIQAGDVIVSIDAVDVTQSDSEDAVSLLRGEVGTSVRLGVRHLGLEEIEEIDVERAEVMVASVLGDTHQPNGDWNFTLEAEPKIGLIRVNIFGDHTTDEFAKAYQQIDDDVDGLIIDLRNNAGGYLSAAKAICDMFIDDGIIVSVKGREGRFERATKAHSDTTIVKQDIFVVVLVNQLSASASEIVAACLQDHKRAVVIGERSYGKGTVQSIYKFDKEKRAIKITTATYWRPSGRNIHRFPDATDEEDWGVSPDEGYEVTVTDDELVQIIKARMQRDIDRSNIKDRSRVDNRVKSDEEIELEGVVDTQLQKAIEYLKEKIN